MNTLVQLPDGSWVNPAHVTCIELDKRNTYPSGHCRTWVWVKKDAGYGAGAIQFDGDRRDELARIVNSVSGAAATVRLIPGDFDRMKKATLSALRENTPPM